MELIILQAINIHTNISSLIKMLELIWECG